MPRVSKVDQSPQQEPPDEADKGKTMVRVIRKKTGHLIEITRDDGTKDVSWDWDQLLADVRAATSVKVTIEEKVEPAAKKPAAKKAATKKKKETK